MCVAHNVAMLGRWYRVFGLLCLVTIFFDFFTSKGRGMCGKVLCISFIWLDGVCLWLGVGVDAGIVFMLTRRGREDRVFRGLYVVSVVCVCVPSPLPRNGMAIQWGWGSVWGADSDVHMCFRQ